MLWGERARRRGALIGLLAVLALMIAAVAFAAVSTRSSGAVPLALPLHPAAGGFEPDDTRLTDCSDERCFQQALGNVAYREGAKVALERVADVYGTGASPACHRATHAVGGATLARNAGGVAKTLAEGSPQCGSGYYHGVLERSLVRVKSRKPDLLAPVARRLCAGAARMTPWVEYQCLHGLGHGLMIATGLNLPISLEVCRRLGRWWDRDACRSGVFMENLSTSYGAQSIFLRDDDPLYPCNWVAREDKRRCYQMVAFRVLGSVGGDFGRAAEVCATVERAFVFMCFRSLGKDASTRGGREAAASAESCGKARPYGGESECIYGAAQDITANFTEGREAVQLCASVAANLAEHCFEAIGSVTGRLTRSAQRREEDCRSLASRDGLAQACMRGAVSALPRG